MKQKIVYVVDAKIKFNDGTIDTFPFYAETDSPGKAETIVEKWLKEGNSNLIIESILSIRQTGCIRVIE